jgi:hypothetical protein
MNSHQAKKRGKTTIRIARPSIVAPAPDISTHASQPDAAGTSTWQDSNVRLTDEISLLVAEAMAFVAQTETKYS